MTLPSRRWGKRITAEASTAIQYVQIAILSKPVDCAGARLMLLVDIPWAHRVWALPFFTVLAPPSGIINLIDIGIKPHRLGTADAGSSATMVAAPSDCPGCR